MSGRQERPGHCGVHHGWAADTVPTGADHGSGGAPAARVCLPCGRTLIERGGASAELTEQIKQMEEREK